jgi:NADH:ubiquinone oxidoreductase subunit 5 (subunit L)/multisubunit Na+/H+ antiporter MnhA subunit
VSKKLDAETGIFVIFDNILNEMNKAKLTIFAMIVCVILIPPLSVLIIVPEFIFENPFSSDNKEIMITEEDFLKIIVAVRVVPLLISIPFIGIGIYQFIQFSKWKKKYKQFREAQQKINEDMDSENY